MRGADWPVLHPYPHQWDLCVVLGLILLSMGPKRERESRKEVEREREKNIAFKKHLSVIPLWFLCEKSNIFSCVICAISLFYTVTCSNNSIIKQIKTGTQYKLYNIIDREAHPFLTERNKRDKSSERTSQGADLGVFNAVSLKIEWLI